MSVKMWVCGHKNERIRAVYGLYLLYTGQNISFYMCHEREHTLGNQEKQTFLEE